MYCIHFAIFSHWTQAIKTQSDVFSLDVCSFLLSENVIELQQPGTSAPPTTTTTTTPPTPSTILDSGSCRRRGWPYARSFGKYHSPHPRPVCLAVQSIHNISKYLYIKVLYLYALNMYKNSYYVHIFGILTLPATRATWHACSTGENACMESVFFPSFVACKTHIVHTVTHK